MGFISVTLFDFDLKNDQPKEPITYRFEYDDDMSLEEQGVKKVSIAAGNEVCTGVVTVPLAMLSSLIGQVMGDAFKRDQPSIIMPERGIIKPN